MQANTFTQTRLPKASPAETELLSPVAEDAVSDLVRAISLSDDQEVAAVMIRQLAAQLAVLHVRDWMSPITASVGGLKSRAAGR